MTHTIMQSVPTSSEVSSQSMMPPSDAVRALLDKIQEMIKQNPEVDSMKPPSDAVRRKLIELGI